MSTLKTTNLQNTDASSANIVLGTGSGGGATISGVTTSTTLRATTGIITSFSGPLTSTGAFTASDDVSFTGASYNAMWDKSKNALILNDNCQLNLGSDEDGDIYHDGTQMIINNGTGTLKVRSNNLQLTRADNEVHVNCVSGAQVELNYSGNKRFETTNEGATVTLASSDTSGTPDKYLNLYNSNNGANTMAGIRFSAASAANTDHWIYQKKHGAGSGTDLIIAHGTSERLRFIESGGFTFNGDTTAANALDDYEEGSANATFKGSEGGSTSLSNAVRYTKIGNYVHMVFAANSFSNNGVGGTLEIAAPFTASNDFGICNWFGGDVYWYPSSKWDTYTDHCGFTPYINAGTAIINFKVKRKDEDRQMALSASNNDQISGASGLYCRFSLSYTAA